MNRRQILVVDDEEQILKMYSLALSRAGYTITTAKSAEEALEIIKDGKFGIFFLDINLPGMNGIELCQRIRKDSPMAILYAVTGYASLFDLSECREAGFEDYFVKPVSLSVLSEAAINAFKKLDRWKSK